MTRFDGFPPDSFAFFVELEKDNTTAFWRDQKPRWERVVRDPMRSLLDELSREFGALRMFRPHRDVRFSTDKSPYKLWAGATSESRAVGGVGYYIEVSASRMITGFGAMSLARDQLSRFRAAIHNEVGGRAFEKVLRDLDARGLPVTPGIDSPLKTVPRNYPADHPRAELLRFKGAAVVREWEPAEWMHTRHALEEIRGVWRAAAPLKNWLESHVGASELPAR